MSAGAKAKQNVEFALSYILSVVKSVDIKEPEGRAAELVAPFLGGEVDTARLFLHELEAWLRSPFLTLRDWDRAVQYREPELGYDKMRRTTT